MTDSVPTGEASQQTPAPKKRRLNSKAKGSGFENTVAKKLSSALTPLKFIRTQGSGARVGGKNFETLGQMFGEDALKLFVGDVVPVNEKEANVEFLLSIECKFYKASDSFEAMVAGSANIFKWMHESETDATKINRIPIIIFKWNHTPMYIGVPLVNLQYQGVRPRLTIVRDGDYPIAIFYLDDVINHREFWVKDKV